jgi:hypothetical protein
MCPVGKPDVGCAGSYYKMTNRIAATVQRLRMRQATKLKSKDRWTPYARLHGCRVNKHVEIKRKKAKPLLRNGGI